MALILLELSLVGNEDGLDLVRYLRKTKKWRDIPISALTAHALLSDRENCIAADCNDYMAKSITQLAITPITPNITPSEGSY